MIAPIEKGDRIRRKFSIRDNRLVPGKYKALLVLYEVGSFGAYEDLDAIWPAFTFEMTDENDDLGVCWNYNTLGRTNFKIYEES